MNVKSKLIFLIAILALLIAVNIFVMAKISRILEAREIDASIVVGDKIGFNITSDFNFGSIILGGSSLRTLLVENKHGFDVEVDIYGKGEMKEFIVPVKKVLQAYENSSIGVVAASAQDTRLGAYKGKVAVIIKKL